MRCDENFRLTFIFYIYCSSQSKSSIFLSKKKIWVRFPSDVGISPMKLQLKRFKCFKDFRLPIESSNFPENNISKKSKNFRKLLPRLTNHSYTPIQKLDLGPRIDLNFMILLAF